MRPRHNLIKSRRHGELGEGQLGFLEDMMEEVGHLDGSQISATFQLLRSKDLIWSRMLRNYLMGGIEPRTKNRRPANLRDSDIEPPKFVAIAIPLPKKER
jgi:hypothetical protein